MTSSAFPHALASDDRLEQECWSGLVISHCWLRPLKIVCYIALIRWVKITKTQAPEKTLFIFHSIVHITGFGLLFSSLFAYTDSINALSLKNSMAQHVDCLLQFIILYEFGFLLPLKASRHCWRNWWETALSPNWIASTHGQHKRCCIVWSSCTLAFRHSFTDSISSECQWCHISHA